MFKWLWTIFLLGAPVPAYPRFNKKTIALWETLVWRSPQQIIAVSSVCLNTQGRSIFYPHPPVTCARLSVSIVRTYQNEQSDPQPPRVFRISFYWTTFYHYLGAWNRLHPPEDGRFLNSGVRRGGGGIKNGTSPNTQLPTFIELGICQIQPSRFSDKHISYLVLSSPAVLIHILLVSRQSYSESDDVQSYLKKKYTL